PIPATALGGGIILIMALANTLLAGLLLGVKGQIPGLYEPVTPIGIGVHVRVVSPVLNVRSDPDAAADVLGQVLSGTKLTVTGVPQNGWVPVHLQIGEEQVNGWVSLDFVSAVPITGWDRIRNRLEQVLP
ncbi:MAG TPA: SH3 domain-containing protein, partial [Thermomicrobiales bacterium]|nr:SH3 domain-containing protein [Thermomicrobiales bacterium]